MVALRFTVFKGLAQMAVGFCLLAAAGWSGGCVTSSGVSTQAPTNSRPVRIFSAVYKVPNSVSVNVVADLQGFKKFQYVNAQTHCTGVWLFNVVGTRTVHEKYVAESIERPMAKSLESRLTASGRVEGVLPVHQQDARAVRYTFSDDGTRFESGYVELFDETQRLSVVTLADCGAGKLEEDQQMVAEVLATKQTQDPR